MKVASFLILVTSSFFAFGSTERLCGDALLSSNPVFEELVRLRRSIDDGSASDLERRARQSDYRVRMREAVKRLDIERELLVSMIEARVRGALRFPPLETLTRENWDLPTRDAATIELDILKTDLEKGSQVKTLSGVAYTEFWDSKWNMQAWKDDGTGLIWSDVIRGLDAKHPFVSHFVAERICTELGGRLATKEEYEKLRADFLNPDKGMYAPQLFMEGETEAYWFWSSVYADLSNRAYYFNGLYGSIGYDSRGLRSSAVRCVRP